jgi:uncharacterized membrane protein
MRRSERILLFLGITYGVATLAHFAHNAVYLHQYPNMPRSLTSAHVWLAWLAVASVGCAGYWLYRSNRPRTGLLLIAIYALLGFGGLDHYTLASPSAHTIAMNATIWGEVVAAAALLLFAARRAVGNGLFSTVSNEGSFLVQ